MKYFLVLVFTYITVLFALSSCDKRTYGNTDDDYCPDDDNAFEDMKAWYYFKEGTYWIYEEQNTGQLDTVIVYSNQENQFDTIYQFEWYANSSTGDQIHQWVNTSWSGLCPKKISCNCQLVWRSYAYNGNFVGEDRPFLYPHIEGNQILNLWVGGLSTVESILTSVQVGTDTYFSVIEYSVEIDNTENDNLSIYRIAKNVGIIEKIIPTNNEDWLLIEYGINQ
jgi:hypothetical protein